MSRTCPTCGREFDDKRSMRIHHSMAHDKHLLNQKCANCGERFHNEYEVKYCSESCREVSVSFEGEANPNYRGGKETTACEICGDHFEYYPSEKPGKYCSSCVDAGDWRDPPGISGPDHPRWKGGKLAMTCDVCEREFERYPSNVTGEVSLCSDECQSEWLSDAFTGDGHPNWRGGGNEDYGTGWGEVRERALERDGYTCVLCGKTNEEMGRNPDVHHIVPVRTFVESPVLTKRDAHTLDNVVSLCIPCHRRAEFGDVSRRRLRWIAGAA